MITHLTLEAGFLEPALDAGFLAVEAGFADARDEGFVAFDAGFSDVALEAGLVAETLDSGLAAAGFDSGLAYRPATTDKPPNHPHTRGTHVPS